MPAALTDRQTEVLNFVTTFYRQHGYGPTYREIGDAIGVGSTNAVSAHVDRMRTKGVLEPDYKTGRARTIIPARGKTCPCCGQPVKGSKA